VPEYVAEELTVPEFITQWNLKEMKEMLKKETGISYVITPNNMRKRITEENRDTIVEELDVGYRIERKIKNGDIVLFNRQPSLHRLSMLAHKVKLMPGKTFRLNPTVCKPYNADFDGDEMNMHVPQTEEGKTEAKELMFVQKQIISPRYGAPVIVLDEDAVSGAFILSLDTTTFSREDAMKYYHIIGRDDLPEPDLPKGRYSGKLIFSALLPKDFNAEYGTKTARIAKSLEDKDPELKKRTDPYKKVVIKEGVLKEGAIDGNSLGEGKGFLVDALAREYSPEVIAEFYDKINKIVEDVVTRFGMSVGLDEYFTNPAVEKAKKSAIEEEMEKGKELEKQYKAGTTEIIPGRNLDESFELHMMRLGAKTKDRVEDEVMKEKVNQVFSDKPEYNSIVMIMSGSRGSSVNLTNIMGLWGQASVREGRPKRGFRDRLITTNKKKDVGSMARGYIKHNFMEGMGPKEYFYHSMGGRQGEVDTGVSTKVSGYLYRRLANSLKDLMVHNDETVRTASKNLIQYHYGEDSMFPANTHLGKNVNVDIQLKKLKSDGKSKVK